MDFFEVIAKRHSVRKYADRPVERELLDRMVSAAETAPSSKNTDTMSTRRNARCPSTRRAATAATSSAAC